MSLEIQSASHRRFLGRQKKVALGALIAATGAIYGSLTALMVRARYDANVSMERIIFQLRENHFKTALSDTSLFSPVVTSRLDSFFAGFGPIKFAQYKIIACQISGRPCVVRLTLRSTSSEANMTLYFYGSRCLEVEQLSVQPL